MREKRGRKGGTGGREVRERDEGGEDERMGEVGRERRVQLVA